ncbi:MAG: sigma 54-interacting transcriptional regulator [Acidobacteriota bacterium]
MSGEGRRLALSDTDRGTVEALMAALKEQLPPGWTASLQLEDSLTQIHEEVARVGRAGGGVEGAGRYLALVAPSFGPETLPRWLLEPLRVDQAVAVVLAAERPFGRLLLLSDDSAPPLSRTRRRRIEALCAEATRALDRARTHLEDSKLGSRLRRVAESELARGYTAACLELMPQVAAVALLSRTGGELEVLRVRSQGQGLLEEYLRRRLPWQGSHLEALLEQGEASSLSSEALLGFAEGQLFAPLLSSLGAAWVETSPLETEGRWAGSLLLIYGGEEQPEPQHSVVGQLNQSLATALDRVRPKRRAAAGLIYLQGLLRSSATTLVDVLRTVVEEMVGFLGADAGVLALIDADTGRLLISEASGYERAVMPQSISLAERELESGGASIAAHVARTGEAFVADETEESPIYLPADPSVLSEIAVPLRLRGETFGVALASSRSRGFFQQEDIPRFQLFADQVAVAVDNARLLDDLRAQGERRTLQTQRRAFGFHPEGHAPQLQYHFGNLVGDPEGPFGTVYRMIERISDREDDIVLISGETGTGKEMVAHAIHNASPRRGRPLVATNFAALGGDPNLIQSELFGHERGAFTGAVQRRKGCFETANQSTLLIDELGDITPAVQVKLLRVLGRSRHRELIRLGGNQTLRSDVRVLAATHRNLRQEVAAGRFREDLYYRLSALVLRIPPLRERPGDIPALSAHILARLESEERVRLQPTAVEVLQRYAWPGNVRQLESVLLRALVLFGDRWQITALDVEQALEPEREAARGWRAAAAASGAGAPGEAVGGQRLPASSPPVLPPASFPQGSGVSPAMPLESMLVCPLPPPPGWFWEQVWRPFKERKLARAAVRALIARTLEETGGFYTRVARRLGVEESDYQRFIDFLGNADLRLDYRPYRRPAAESS